MKDSKVERIRQKVLMLKRQFLQGDAGLFDQALSNHELTAIMSELVPPHRERIYPPLDTLRLFVGQVLSADRAPRRSRSSLVRAHRIGAIHERTQHQRLL